VADAPDLARDLARLESDLKRLEAEYNMFFAGRLPRPPWETRSRVEALVKTIDRAYIPNYGDRFRFTTLQSRFATFVELWDRGLRAREEGRAGGLAAARKPAPPADQVKKGDHILHVSAFRDPVREVSKLTELYDSLVQARQQVGESAPPFHKFAELVRTQVKKLQDGGSPEVAFRVAVKEGKVSFTAKPLKENKK